MTQYHENCNVQSSLASVPGLPRFDLPFAFTMIHEIRRSAKSSSATVYYCECKRKVKMGEGWERGSTFFQDSHQSKNLIGGTVVVSQARPTSTSGLREDVL